MRISSCLILLTCLFGLCLCSAPSAEAQFGGDRIQRPINTPAFSPYLNLFRTGDSSGPVLNYYGLVRPQLNAIEQNQQLGQGLQSLQMQQMRQQPMPGISGPVGMTGFSQLGITGHPVVFQSYSAGGGGAAGGGFAGAGFAGGGFNGGGQSFGGSGGAAFGGGFGQSSGYAGGFGGVGMSGGSMGGISGHPAAFGIYNQTGR